MLTLHLPVWEIPKGQQCMLVITVYEDNRFLIFQVKYSHVEHFTAKAPKYKHL